MESIMVPVEPILESALTSETAPKKTRKKRVATAKAVKAPKKIKAGKKGNTGKRYSEEQRKEILDFIAASGRGGITAAIKKWGVSYIAIRSWLKKGGGKGAKAGRKAGRSGKRGRPAGSGKGRGRPAAAKPSPLLTKRAHKKIQKALDRMGHGIRLLAEAFSHLT